MTIDKTTLIAQTAEALAGTKAELTPKQVGIVLNTLLEQIQANVEAGERVGLTGFGTFERRHRSARIGVNPQTKAPLAIDAVTTVGFTVGETFRARISGVQRRQRA